jgi:hypothetical protein
VLVRLEASHLHVFFTRPWILLARCFLSSVLPRTGFPCCCDSLCRPSPCRCSGVSRPRVAARFPSPPLSQSRRPVFSFLRDGQALSLLPIFLSARSRAYVFDLSLAFLRSDFILSSAHAVALVPAWARTGAPTAMLLLKFSFGSSKVSIFVWISVWIVAKTHPGYVLELPDQRIRAFLVLIALNRLIPEYVRKLFGKIPVRI